MINRNSIVIIILIFSVPFKVLANQETIRLICEYSHTINQKGASSPTTGGELFTVNYSRNGKAQVKKQDLDPLFFGTITEEEIFAETYYKVQDISLYQILTINRYTGSLELRFGMPGKGSIIHYGKCKTIANKLF